MAEDFIKTLSAESNLEVEGNNLEKVAPGYLNERVGSTMLSMFPVTLKKLTSECTCT